MVQLKKPGKCSFVQIERFLDMFAVYFKEGVGRIDLQR